MVNELRQDYRYRQEVNIVNTEKKQEPANSDIMTKLVKIEEEIEKAEKRLYQK